MSFSFQIEKPKNVTQVFSKLKSEAAKHNISFSGDETGGRGSGYGFDGEYAVRQDCIEVTVHKKPFLISEAKIKQTAREFLAQIDADS